MTKEERNAIVCENVDRIRAEIHERERKLELLLKHLKDETHGENMHFGDWDVEHYNRSFPYVNAGALRREDPDTFARYGEMRSSNILKVKARM